MAKKMDMKAMRIGIIGCGRITEVGHLPAVLSLPYLNLTALVDKEISYAEELRQKYNLNCQVVGDYRSIDQAVDGVIIATPNSTHFEIASYFLKRKIHTLVEKPLTTKASEAIELNRLAGEANCVLCVGFVTRFFPSTTLMKRMIELGYMGKIKKFKYEFGSAGGWAPISGYNLDRESAGGGVLVVSGTHFIDRMLYWFGEPEIVECSSDSHGGVEANFQATFSYVKGGEEFTGDFYVSKTYKLRNSLVLEAEKYDAVLPEGQSEWIKLIPKDGGLNIECLAYPENSLGKRTDYHYFMVQLENFAECIRSNQKPLVDGEWGSRSVKLVEEMYNRAKRMSEPWIWSPRTGERQKKKPSNNGKILITGASGLVGGALSERLFFEKIYPFRAMIHSTGNAARIARLPIELVRADLLNKKEVEEAVKGCSMIVNLVRGGKVVDTKGLENLLNAALRFGVKKLVHLSSVAVYGDNPPKGSETESYRPDPGGNSYGRLKLEQERLVQKFVKKGLPAVVLRPPNICGPFSTFTLSVFERVKSNQVIFLDGGRNPCNVVHVYNLVDAILLSLESEICAGETYFVTDGESLIWKEFIEAHVRIINPRANEREVSWDELTIPVARAESLIESIKDFSRFLVSGEFRQQMSEHVPIFGRMNALLYQKFQLLSPDTQRWIRKYLSRPQVVPQVNSGVLYDAFIALQHRNVRYSIEKARKELRYEPRLNFTDGFANTVAWLKSAKYLC